MSRLDDLLVWLGIRSPVQKDMAALYPETQDRTHIASVSSDQVGSTQPYNYLAALGHYAGHVWVRKAVTTIANNLSPLPIQVFRDDVMVEDHPLHELLEEMNENSSAEETWQQWVIDMMLGGEEGWEVVFDGKSQPVEIYPRQPHTFTITPEPGRARYRAVSHYTIDDNLGKPYTLPPSEFIHFKFFNPQNVWRGISIISAVRTSVVIDVMAQAWSKNWMAKGARPDYAIITPEGVTATERKDLEERLRIEYGGVNNVGRPLILEQGITDIRPLDFRPKDMEWVAQREISRDEIGGMFGVPDILMGFGNDSYDTEIKRTAALQVLFSLTIIPLVEYRDKRLTKYFRKINSLKPNEKFITDLSKVAALKSDLKDKILMWQILTNGNVPSFTASTFLGLGLDRYEGDDKARPVAAPAPLMLPGNGNGNPPPSENQDGQEGQDETTPPKRLRIPARSKSAVPEYGSSQHRQKMDQFERGIASQERRVRQLVRSLFADQQEEVIARLEAQRTFSGSSKSAGDVAENPFDIDKWEKEFERKIKPQIKRIVQDSGRGALLDLGASISFDVFEPAVVEFLTARAQRFAVEVNATTWAELQDSLSAGLKEGESIRDLQKRVESIMQDRIMSSSETIARTETIGAANGGTLLAWDQSGLDLDKAWLAALDDRTRESHAEAHGQVVGLKENFSVGAGEGPAPGQIGIAEEDINCRCTMTAIVK